MPGSGRWPLLTRTGAQRGSVASPSGCCLSQRVLEPGKDPFAGLEVRRVRGQEAHLRPGLPDGWCPADAGNVRTDVAVRVQGEDTLQILLPTLCRRQSAGFAWHPVPQALPAQACAKPDALVRWWPDRRGRENHACASHGEVPSDRSFGFHRVEARPEPTRISPKDDKTTECGIRRQNGSAQVQAETGRIRPSIQFLAVRPLHPGFERDLSGLPGGQVEPPFQHAALPVEVFGRGGGCGGVTDLQVILLREGHPVL